MRTLESLSPGETAIVKDIQHEQMASRLISMGLIPGVEIQLVRKSFSGATAIFRIREMLLALRKTEAQQIILK